MQPVVDHDADPPSPGVGTARSRTPRCGRPAATVSEKRQPAPGRQQFLDWITASFAGHDDGAQPLFRVDSYALTLKPGRRGLHCEPHSQS